MRESNRAVWGRLSPLLDRALDLDPAARHDLVASLRSDEPSVADALERLLAEHDRVAASDFLETAPFAPAAPMAGRSVGGYTLVRPLGAGGMGTVWLAARSDGRFEGHVALKFLNLSGLDDAARERFRREGTLLARLSHPNIARLFDAGVSDAGQPFLVLEHVEGTRIDRYADDHRLDVGARLTLLLQVADAVAHAHANLVVHRDLKPSNVLVDGSGRTKLLDFGIAALVDESSTASPSTLTLAAGAALTPEHAAPEQAAGGTVTTATDVYALGVLLYQMLTGRHPTMPGEGSSHSVILRALAECQPRRPSDVVSAFQAVDPDCRRILDARSTTRDRLARACKGDLDTIAAKALKKDSRERYQSVEALADDVRRHLKDEPIAARPDSFAYRSRKFVRRHRLGVAAMVAVVVSLSAGMYVANRERVKAEHRFGQVRALANRVLRLDSQIRLLPGSTAARHEVVAMAKDYLEALRPDAEADIDLALELAFAYYRLASAQGVPSTANLGLSSDAAESLGHAEALFDSVLARTPRHPTALLQSANVFEARMMLADNARRDEEALRHARRAVERVDLFLAGGQATDAQKFAAAQLLGNVALFHKNAGQYAEAIAYARRNIALVPAVDRADEIRAQSWSIIADAMRLSGDLDGALAAIRESRRLLEHVPASDAARIQARFNVLWREGLILGEEGRISLGRSDEAIVAFQGAFDLVEDWASKDTANAGSRVLVANAARELGELLRRRDPARALAAYDRALHRLGEVKDNPRARRSEVELLSGSSYPLRALGRSTEARQRLDDAFARLQQLETDLVNKIELGSETDTALRARADHLADTGDTARAIDTYRALHDRVSGTAAPRERLIDACSLSRLYEALSSLHRRAGEGELASDFDTRRLELWRHWNARLPGNAFVQAQLAARVQ